MTPLLEMRGISKVFPGVRALDHVSLTVQAGEIHAICGENGAGKSTLMKVLSGVYPHGSYEGEIVYDGKSLNLRGIRDSETKGIIIIQQELALVPLLSIAENLFLGNEVASQPTVPPTVPATVPSTIPDLAVVEAAQGFEIEPTDEVFVLMVSNQSFEDDPVGLQISIEVQVVADDRYVVGSQHTVTTYVVRGLAPGSHELSVTSDTGVSFVSRVRAAEGRPRWAYLTYWYHPDDTDDHRCRYVAVT